MVTPEDIGLEEEEAEEPNDETRAMRNKRLNFYSECNSSGSVGGFSSGKVLMKLEGENSSRRMITFSEMGDEYKICGVQVYSPKYRQISLKDSHNNLGNLRTLPHSFVNLLTYRNTENQSFFRRLLSKATRELEDLVRLNQRRICLMNDPGNFRVRIEFYLKTDFKSSLSLIQIPIINPSDFVYVVNKNNITRELKRWMLMTNKPLERFLNQILKGSQTENRNSSLFSELNGT